MKSMFSLKFYILKIFTLLAALFLAFIFTAQVNAATLSLSPANGTTTVGQTFTVDILIDTQGVATDGVDIGYLRFNPNFLEVLDSDVSKAGIQIQAGTIYPGITGYDSATNQCVDPTPCGNVADNTNGTIYFSRTSIGRPTPPSPPRFTGAGTVATITFRAKAAGTAFVTFDAPSSVDMNIAGGGADVLTSVTSGSYIISSAEAPTCTSFTYSPWSQCKSDNTQTRTITSSSPQGCTGGNPEPLTQSCVYTPPDTTSPVISNIQVANITPTTATITWSTNEASNTQVQYGLTAQYGQATSLNQSLTTAHSATITELSPNTTYHYSVKSTDASSNSSISTDRTFTTTGLPDKQPPSAITDLTTSFINHKSITLNWSSPGDDGNVGTAASYDIRYSMSAITENTWNSAMTLDGEPTPKVFGSSQNYDVVDLSPSTTYYFAIKSKDEAGNISPISNIASATTNSVTVNPILGCTDPSATNYNKNATEDDGTCVYPSSGGGGGSGGGSSGGGGGVGGSYFDTIAPDKPSNFKAEGADRQIILKWNNPKDKDFARVILFRSTQEIPDNIAISSMRTKAEIIYEGTAENYTDINLDNNTTYYYAIYAHDKRPNYSSPAIIKSKPEAGKTTITITETQQTSGQTSGSSYLNEGQASYITSNLSLGQNSEEVRLLQQMLARDSTIYPEATISGYYGSLTERAVKKFQCRYLDICSGSPDSNGYGSVGPITRKKLNEVFASRISDSNSQITSNTQTTSQTTTIIPPSGLSQSQINSVLALLESFGVEQDMIDNVRISLQGGTISYQSSQSPDAAGYAQTATVTGKITGPFSIGMTSDQVMLLQQMLARDSTIYPEAITSGYYGSLTRKAVERFQCKYMNICSGTPSENGYGLAGPATRAKLNEIYGGEITQTVQQTPSPAQTPTPTETMLSETLEGPFSIGMTSDQVMLLQQMLARDSTIYPEAITSGYYGSLTRKAVERFQCKYMNICSGTPSENGYGLAGPATRAKINEILAN